MTKTTYRTSIISGIALSLLLGYNNCSHVGFENSQSAASSVGSQSTGDAGAILDACTAAKAKGSLQILNQTVEFADSRAESGRATICQWGQNGNLARANGYLTARYEQTQILKLPSNATICNVQMQTALQSFRYDDDFIFTFNDTVIASNTHTGVVRSNFTNSPIQMSTGEMVDSFTYDWNKMAGVNIRDIPNSRVDDYCLGESEGLSTCSWPLTEQSGSIVFNYNPELLINLGAKAAINNQHFGFVITGDNDDSLDCYHQALSFNMAVTYYTK